MSAEEGLSGESTTFYSETDLNNYLLNKISFLLSVLIQ